MATPRIMKAILGLVAFGSCLLQVKADSPTVDLTMVAPWSAPNFLIEIAETVSTHNETAYFDFIKHFISLEEKSSSWSQHQIYEEALKVISNLGQDETNFFKIALAVHEAAPRIESYNQYYRESIVPLISAYDDGCNVWAQVNDKQVCNHEKLVSLISDTSSNDFSSGSVKVLPFDHIICPTNGNPSQKTVVLYTNQFSADFAEFHKILENAVNEHSITYIIRYRSPPSTLVPGNPLYLSGYGVEMALKKTDYLVIDDRASDDTSSKDSIKDKLSGLGKKIGQTLFQAGHKATIEPLTPLEIQSLGFKAAQYVAKSFNPLETLTRLSQDFPKYAKSISAIELDKEFEEEISHNQMSFLRSGMNAVWLNGKGLEYSQVDPFYLVRALRKERKLVQSLQDLGFTTAEAIHIISSPALTKASKLGKGAGSEVYDVRDSPEEPFVVWWNDLEKDSRYKEWSADMTDFLRPSYPGQLPPVKKNIFNLIMVEDLAQVESLTRIVTELQMMIKRIVPIRFGNIYLIKEDESPSTLIAKALNYIIDDYGKGYGMNFLTQLLETIKAERVKQPTREIIENTFISIVSNAGKPKSQVKKDFQEVLINQDSFAKSSRDLLTRMGINELGFENGIMFLNGRLLEFNDEKPWVQVAMPSLTEQTREIQQLIYSGQLTDDIIFYEYVLSQPNVVRNRNSYISPSNAHPLHMLAFDHTINSNRLQYLSNANKDKDENPNINLWVSSDFNVPSGLKLAYEALSFAESVPEIRIALIHNPQAITKSNYTNTVIDEKNEPRFSDLLYNLIYEKNADFNELKTVISEHIENNLEDGNAGDKSSEVVTPGSPIIEFEALGQGKKWTELTAYLQKDGLSKSFSGIIINGRVIGPLPTNTIFTEENFEALYTLENTKRIAPIEEAIIESEHKLSGTIHYADILSKLSALIETDKADTSKSFTEDNEPVNRNRIYQLLKENKHSRLVVGDNKHTFLEVGIIMDPLSETAQKWTPVIQALSEIEGVSVIIHLNPVPGLTELPLKRFYRYVFDKEPHFDKLTGNQMIPTAYFEDLPVEPLYTLGVETTNGWHVTVREANMDLDNILLTSLKESQSSVSAVYELESILIEGHCLDSTTKSPPRGLQFEISSPANTEKKDTLVMANLGYFQLKALPGVWNLGLREGRSSDVYAIEDVGTEGKWNWDAAGEGNNKALALTSFEGLTVMPLVHKNPGMESEDVLEGTSDKKDNDGLWSSFSNKLFGKKDNEDETGLSTKPKQAEINIFSVASGKLYERFLSIMIASVMEHTESTVKFWFIENFLSPEFKDFVPHMAKEYGFEYEMVTYKWPSWLRAQQEKQRTIWGYKILFLDVLFPLSLDKVIFVDADQIVRTDLKELVDMDLKGAPYGYTPFCSDRKEMDGFRFWSDGYWKSHLNGKPYHISALYVVDLVRFRQLAAGDRLRAQYQQLSADPNSLANLDQDLPNNMQHIVPIFSLPQEWLWCETWCSDESLKTAKTIDLCNNPLTKEPKLDRARRQIPEWESYDDEIDRLRRRIANAHSNSVIINDDQIVIQAPDTHNIKPVTHSEKHLKDEL